MSLQCIKHINRKWLFRPLLKWAYISCHHLSSLSPVADQVIWPIAIRKSFWNRFFLGSISRASDRPIARLLFSPVNAPKGTLTSHYCRRMFNVLGAVMILLATTTFIMKPNGRIVMNFYNCAFIELQYVERLQILLKFDNNNGYFTWRCTHIHAICFFSFFVGTDSLLCVVRTDG